jgi:tetratricopeptide (TPR) repeat protein
MRIDASKILVCSLVGFAAALAACSGGESRKERHLEKGQQFMAAGNLEKARVEFRNALQIAPNDSQARYENGVVDEKLGNHREAAGFFQAAIDTNADNIPARVALGRILLRGGAPEPALNAVKPAFDKHTDDAGLLTIRAAAEAQLKEPEPALKDAERAVQIDPKNEDAVSVLAAIEAANGQADRAIALLENGIKQNAGSVDLRLQLAQLYGSHNQPERAEGLLVDLVRLKPAEKAHRIRLAQYYAQLNRVDDAERVLRDGVKALPRERELKISLVDLMAARRGRDAAEKQLQEFIAQEPKDYDLRFSLARFYEQGRDPAKAEAVYRQVIDDAGTDGPGLVARDQLARLLSLQNDVPGAEKLLGEVLQKAPRDDDALFLRGNLALQQKDPKSAIADLRSVLRDQPNASGAMRALARAHLANGEPALAEETMRRAVDTNPGEAEPRLDLAKLLIDLGKPEQAKPIIDDLVEQQPANVNALGAQFKIAAATRDLATAKTAADAIVATDPKQWLGYFDQGVVAEREQHTGDAARLYAAALDQTPTAIDPLRALISLQVKDNHAPDALHRLDDLATRYPQSAFPLTLKGSVLLSLKKPADAIVAFQHAVQREPKSANGYHDLAVAQMAANDRAAAISTLQVAIDKVTSPEPLQAALAGLYQQGGKTDEAIKVYDDALRRNPESDAMTNNLAMLLIEAKSDQASLLRAKQLAARFANSTNPSYLDTYGWVLFKEGEASSAVPVLETASSKAPSLAEPWYHLGMAQAQTGQAAAAKVSLAHSLQSGRDFEGKDEAKATLDKLDKQSPAEARSPS